MSAVQLATRLPGRLNSGTKILNKSGKSKLRKRRAEKSTLGSGLAALALMIRKKLKTKVLRVTANGKYSPKS